MIVTLCIVGVVAVVWAVACVVLSSRHPEPIWDWDTIDTSDIAFPENFLWGLLHSKPQLGNADYKSQSFT